MHIPQDVVDLIVDQLFLPADNKWRRHLRAASLVSTLWVDRSQHHLFSSLRFHDGEDIEKWCSRIKPDPCGVSRHVRVLALGVRGVYAFSDPRPWPSAVETALPHLISLKNLQELILDIVCTPLTVLAPIFSAFPGILGLCLWVRRNVDIHETWKDMSTLADISPKLTRISLSGYRDRLSEIHIRLSANEESLFAINCFKFHELKIFFGIPLSLPFFEACGPHLQVLDLHELDMWYPHEDDCRAFQTLLEACHTLRVLNFNFTFSPGITQLLGSIPSSSVSLIRVSNPLRIGGAPMTYSNSWPWKPFEEFEDYCSWMDDDDLAEFTHLGVSIRKIAQRYSDRHSGLKTRVRVTLDLSESEIQAVENGEKPFYKTRLEEELGDHVDLELILVVLPEPEPYESDTDG